MGDAPDIGDVSREGFRPSRTDSYIGVMIDDLVTRGISEPYRMFTSRAEYRLRLRADNADQRLTPLAARLGCVSRARSEAFAAKEQRLQDGEALLTTLDLTPTEAARHGLEINRDGKRRSAYELLASPGITIERLRAIWPRIGALPAATAAQLEVDARYAVYLDRQDADIAAFRRDEALALPDGMDFAAITGLSTEVRQKLVAHQPTSLGQAARIDGVTPAALMLLQAHAKRKGGKARQAVASRSGLTP